MKELWIKVEERSSWHSRRSTRQGLLSPCKSLAIGRIGNTMRYTPSRCASYAIICRMPLHSHEQLRQAVSDLNALRYFLASCRSVPHRASLKRFVCFQARKLGRRCYYRVTERPKVSEIEEQNGGGLIMYSTNVRMPII